MKKPPPPIPLKRPEPGTFEDTVELPVIEIPAPTTCPWCHKPIELRRVKD